ncbi:ComF family protein [Paenibacillus sp. LHD-38]|uniref:ComF family protein n=1 Tax=Paenibacillus sp. LHD-38 TaxID=3072143 RepID=UPI00280F9F92|nr:ComF family protein [Paenibacillus sp. LHD-38]MDQ8734028.1 ComF family protein [Paenibacillus sp. LHD-38]
MTVSPQDWLRRLQSAFAGAAQLLAPRTAACLLCGKPQTGSRSADSSSPAKLTPQLRQSLCGACLSAIPWLTRIACTRCGRGIPCEDCIRSPHGSFVCNRSAVHYNQTMRAMLALYKYRGNEQLAPLLGDMLLPAFEALTAEIVQRTNAPNSRDSKLKIRMADHWDAVTYVPVSAEREADRGFNQAEQLAGRVAQRYHLPLKQLLVRSRHSEKQSFKTRAERFRDTRSLFDINAEEFQLLLAHAVNDSGKTQASRRGIRILLIDDIYTTGSTAEACSQVLLHHAERPLEVYLLTWARS